MDNSEDVKTLFERHEQSRQWMKKNWYDEWTEALRALKLRTRPIMKRNAAGNETDQEDTSRTNVCMPGPNLSWRRGVARMTASRYELEYIGPVADEITEMLSAQAAMQYDRSGEAQQDRRVVMSAKAFGVGWGKLFWDSISRTMKFRRALVKGGKVILRDRASIMQSQGAPQDEIQQATQELGPQMSDEEVQQFIGRVGNEVQIAQEVSSYEGPVLRHVFVGDLFLMPGCLSLDESDFAIEQYSETDLWLERMVKSVKYLADDGKTYIQAFNPGACQDLLDSNPEPDKKIDDLRQWFLGAAGKQDEELYSFPSRLRARKRFDVLEQHCLGDDGRMWVTWAAKRAPEKPLGRMPYPWDLGGKYTYTEMVPLEDMVSPFGDSTIRLMRYLHALDNRTVAQNFDLHTNVLQRFLLVQENMEIGDEVVTRGHFRELRVPDVNKIKILDEQGVPPAALEREAMIQRRMAQLDPQMNTVDTGTNSNPMAGKLATTALLNAKAADSLTQYEIDGRDFYLKGLGEKKLAMNRQAAQEPWNIDQQYWGAELSKRVEGLSDPLPEWALSSRGGRTAAVRLDPMDIQVEMECRAKSMSYLSVDDELRQSAAMRLGELAAQFPHIVDARKVVQFAASTIRNLHGKPDDYLLPEQTGPAPPPFKGNLAVNIPLDKMPSDVVNQILPAFGLQPSEELAHRDTLDAVGRLNKAGADAVQLTSPAHAAADSMPPLPGVPGNGKPKAKKSQPTP